MAKRKGTKFNILLTKGNMKKSKSQIQGTNDFNMVSKCSMAKNGYFRDDYLCHFVTKCSRRTPLIHLGYCMRLLTVDFTLRSFLGAMSGQPTQLAMVPCTQKSIFMKWTSEKLLIGKPNASWVQSHSENVLDLLKWIRMV